MICAIGTVMDAPFRMYDEYDVYMDESVRVPTAAVGCWHACMQVPFFLVGRHCKRTVCGFWHGVSGLQMRKLSTDLLTEAAKQRPNVQFIFITPHDILYVWGPLQCLPCFCCCCEQFLSLPPGFEVAWAEACCASTSCCAVQHRGRKQVVRQGAAIEGTTPRGGCTC